ncbi:MAG: glycosyltransferase [Synergistaceae bacterium]|nr:glycosyltransferase [Synergistaceae bacterium]
MHERMYNQPLSRSDSSCPLISVIVPIYKVEKYLDRCITSIVNQTYTNLEIILVDDGSPDNCPAMCDEWAKRDERIRVIHKENGGLSSARNAGLDVMNGEYVSMIDSDDFILPEMFETLYRLMIENDADLGISGYFYVDENGIRIDKDDMHFKKERESEDNETFDVLSAEEALKIFVTSQDIYEVLCYLVIWNKLYSVRIFQELRFFDGSHYEDDIAAHHILGESRRTVITHRKLYMYVQRDDSIMGNMWKGYFTARDIEDDLLRFTDRYEYLRSIRLNDLAYEVLVQSYRHAMYLLMRESYIKYFREFNRSIISIFTLCLRSPGIRMKLRSAKLLLKVLRNVIRDIYRTAKKFIMPPK